MPKDYYHILGLEKKRESCRNQKGLSHKSKSLHPDKNQSVNAEKEFQELNEAYIVLSNSYKRNLYDSGRK